MDLWYRYDLKRLPQIIDPLDNVPIERKKLLRTAVMAAYFRGSVLVGLTPTDALMPLALEKLCNCGEGRAAHWLVRDSNIIPLRGPAAE